MCNNNRSSVCSHNAKISETLSYTILSLESISTEEPFKKIVNYDNNRTPLPITNFTLFSTTDNSLFRLETDISHKGIAYLYTKNPIIHQKLYKIIINAQSLDTNTGDNGELTYFTTFVIYLYLI